MNKNNEKLFAASGRHCYHNQPVTMPIVSLCARASWLDDDLLHVISRILVMETIYSSTCQIEIVVNRLLFLSGFQAFVSASRFNNLFMARWSNDDKLDFLNSLKMFRTNVTEVTLQKTSLRTVNWQWHFQLIRKVAFGFGIELSIVFLPFTSGARTTVAQGTLANEKRLHGQVVVCA